MTMFRIIHDRRGATAIEFTLVLLPLLMFIFFIFDVSRYALTLYSVSHLPTRRRDSRSYAIRH
jgi:Flp pilus assembly protein TadG